MRRELLDYLLCPACSGALELRVDEEEGDEVISGTVGCAGCDTAYPIARGVPE